MRFPDDTDSMMVKSVPNETIFRFSTYSEITILKNPIVNLIMNYSLRTKRKAFADSLRHYDGPWATPGTPAQFSRVLKKIDLLNNRIHVEQGYKKSYENRVSSEPKTKIE